MPWDAHLRAFGGITVRPPGDAPRTFKNSTELAQWHTEQKLEEKSSKRRSKKTEKKKNATEQGKGPTPKKKDDENCELRDTPTSAPDEIPSVSKTGKAVVGEKAVEEAIPVEEDDIDEDELERLFLSAPDEITWESKKPEIVGGKKSNDGDDGKAPGQQARSNIQAAPGKVVSIPDSASSTRPVVDFEKNTMPPTGNLKKKAETSTASTTRTTMNTPPRTKAIPPAFPLTLPPSPISPEKSADISKKQPAATMNNQSPILAQEEPKNSAPQQNQLLQSFAHMVGVNKEHSYGKLALDMHENLKNSKTKVVFSPAVLPGPSNTSSTGNAPKGGQSSKRKAAEGLANGPTKRVHQGPTAPVAASELVGGTVSPESVALIKKGVWAALKAVLDEIRDHNTAFGIPTWPDRFPLSDEGKRKMFAMQEAAVASVVQSLKGTENKAPIQAPSPSQATGANPNEGNPVPGPIAGPSAKPAAGPPTGSKGQNSPAANSQGKGLCRPNIVQVAGSAGLLINGGTKLVPLAGIPKSHQKKASKGKVPKVTVNLEDSAATQAALQAGDVAKAREIMGRTMQTLTPDPSPAASAKKTTARKRSSTKSKKTDNKNNASVIPATVAPAVVANGAATPGFVFTPIAAPIVTPVAAPIAAPATGANVQSQSQTYAEPGPSSILPFPVGIPVVTAPVADGPPNASDTPITQAVVENSNINEWLENNIFGDLDFDFSVPGIEPATDGAPSAEAALADHIPNGQQDTPQNTAPDSLFGDDFHLDLEKELDSVTTGSAAASPQSDEVPLLADELAQSSSHTAGNFADEALVEQAIEAPIDQTINLFNDDSDNAPFGDIFAELDIEQYRADDLMAAKAKNEVNTPAAVARFVQDQCFIFRRSEIVEWFCRENNLPCPYSDDFKSNETAPHLAVDPTTVWKSQDRNHCSIYSGDDIMWAAVVDAWNNAPARYRFARAAAKDSVEPFTPYHFLASGLISMHRDPRLFVQGKNMVSSMTSWAAVMAEAKRDQEFGVVVGDVYPEYRYPIQWDVNVRTNDEFFPFRPSDEIKWTGGPHT